MKFIEIVSLGGQLVRHASIRGSSQFSIDLNGLKRGTYVLLLQGTGKEYSIPFVKE